MPKKEKIVFATNNLHKLEELRQILGSSYEILSLKEIGCFDDIPETADTLAGNAELKARHVKEKYGYDCFADDSGLMVDALNGAPGVKSARYASEQGHDSKANMRKLLSELHGKDNRKAHFSTVIALIEDDEIRFFEGRVDGSIIDTPRGEGGFGYDPVFVPDDADGSTFAEMAPEAKNAISHRGRAVAKLTEWLSTKR